MNTTAINGDSSNPSLTSSTPCISYFIEYQARLRVVQVFLTCNGWPEGPGTIKLSVAEDANLEANIIFRPGDDNEILESFRSTLSLPTAVAGIVLTRQVEELDGEHSFKLFALPNSSAENSLINPLRPPLSAQELQALNPSNIICSHCTAPIIDLPNSRGSSPITYKNLPSAHWREIADAWLCHPKGGDDFTQRYSKKMEEGFWPDDATVLVSLWEMWIDGSMMVQPSPPSQVSLPCLLSPFLPFPSFITLRAYKEGQSPTQSSFLREWLTRTDTNVQ